MDSTTKSEQAAATAEARTGLDPWETAELPAPPRPKGSAGCSVVGPGVIVLGVVDRQRRVPARPGGIRPARAVAAVGHRRRGLLPDHLQHRGDALHAGDRRAGVHRLHAHAAVVARSGRGSTPCCTSCRSAGRRGPATAAGAIFFLFAATARLATDDRRNRSTSSASRPSCRASRSCWSAGASSARSRCSTGCWSRCILGGFLVLAVLFVPGATGWPRSLGFVGFDLDEQGAFEFLPAGADFFLLGALVALLGRGRRRQHHARRTGRATRATAWASARATSLRPSADAR